MFSPVDSCELAFHATLKQEGQKQLFFQKPVLHRQFELHEPNKYLQNWPSVLPIPAGNLMVSCMSQKEACQPASMRFMPQTSECAYIMCK